MTATIQAPSRMGRRAQVEALLTELPADLSGAGVQLVMPAETLPTSSFIDEFVRQVLVDRRAARLELLGADEYVRSVATMSAEDFGVAGRIFFVE